MKKCSFTGHRQIKPEHRKELPSLLARAINYAYNEGCRVFMTGGAIGFDTYAAREIIRYRVNHPDVQLHLVLPCVEQSDKWSDAQKDAYNFILAHSDEVIYVSEDYYDGCNKERNLRLATEADILIAYASNPYSGSMQTVRMAEKQNKSVYNLYPHLENKQF